MIEKAKTKKKGVRFTGPTNEVVAGDKTKLKFSIGRPADYNSVEELTKVIESYFEVTNIEDYTVTGLSLYLGFNSRQSLLNYQGKPEFMDTIKKAKQMIEYSYEIDLKKKGNTGTIFALKNFDWKDKSEVENINMNFNKDMSDSTDDELDKIISS